MIMQMIIEYSGFIVIPFVIAGAVIVGGRVYDSCTKEDKDFYQGW